MYKDKIFLIDDHVLEPDQYSIFLEQNLKINVGDLVLDLVTGSGFHAIMMSDKARKVIGVDLNPDCVKCARRNVLLNNAEEVVEIRAGNLYEAIESNEKFNLIVAWPPQFPASPEKKRNDWYGIATEGGKDGRDVIDKIILGAPDFLRKNGRIQILQAWYSNVPQSLDMLRSLGFDAEITAEAFFPVGHLSYERATYLEDIGFPLIEKDGKLVQHHSVITGWWSRA